jgi:hypothetical protein
MRSWNIGSDKDGESIQRVGFSKKIIIVTTNYSYSFKVEWAEGA